MECLICKKRIQIKERIAKIICANIIDDQDLVEYDQPEDEGMVHIDCFKKLVVQEPSVAQDTPIVERTDILKFLGE